MSIRYILIAMGVTAAVAVLQELLVHALPRLFPLSDSRAERLRNLWLRRRHEEEMNELGVAEYVLSFIAMVALPLGGYQLLVRSVRGAPENVVVFWGDGLFGFMNVVAGIFLGPFLTRWYIRARFGKANELLDVYEHSEDRHGAAGRALMRYAGWIALVLIIASVLLSANQYTVVKPADVVKITRDEKKHFVVLRNGESLAISARQARRLSVRSGTPVSDP